MLDFLLGRLESGNKVDVRLVPDELGRLMISRVVELCIVAEDFEARLKATSLDLGSCDYPNLVDLHNDGRHLDAELVQPKLGTIHRSLKVVQLPLMLDLEGGTIFRIIAFNLLIVYQLHQVCFLIR